jgi:3-hydroxymyristoyl/3-hydroxydecanoyl-(acyl carrier protein) dehydratase
VGAAPLSQLLLFGRRKFVRGDHAEAYDNTQPSVQLFAGHYTRFSVMPGLWEI